jgi:hypothetical protein
MQGLVLLSRIQNNCISTDEKVLEFCNKKTSPDALQQQLNIDRKLYINTCLMKTFDWSKITYYLQVVLNEAEGNLFAEPSAGESLERKWYEQSLEHQKVGDRFMMQLDKLLLQAETEGYTQLKNRTEAAVGYFKKSLEEQLAALQEYMDKLQSQKRISKFQKLLKKLKVSLQRKTELMNTALQIATGLATGETTDNLLNYTIAKPTTIEMPEEPVIIKKEKAPKGTTQRLSLEMFKAGKTIQEIATERNLAISTIETHLSAFISTGEIIITELLPQEKIDHILNTIKDVPEGESFLTNVKQKLGDEYSYGEIRAVMAYKKSGMINA